MPVDSAAAIEACYDAALDFRRWPEALQKLANSVGATSCVIRTQDRAHPFRSDQRRRAVTPDSLEHAEFAALWLQRIEGAADPHSIRPKQPANTFFVEDQLTTQEQREALPYYQEIARPGNREWWASLCVSVNSRCWHLSLFRDSRRGRFYQNEAGDFLRLATDIKRIISTAEKVWDTAVSTSLASLDQFNCAAMLLNCGGQVSKINQRAEGLLATGLAVHQGRIRAKDRASDVGLQELIASALAGRIGDAAQPEPAIIRRDLSPWLLAEALPMTRLARDLFNGGEVLLYFSDLTSEPMPSEQLLTRVFRLSPAEARLASTLATGKGIGAASDRLAISRETARTQLQAIFEKTGARRQAELAAILSRLRGSQKG
jgi:DNA-binding CsgD family transcriptional regulator